MEQGGDMKFKFADIHVHTSLKPFNNCSVNGIYPSLWDKLPDYGQGNPDPFKQLNPIIRFFLGGMARTSQANLDECVKGNLLCPFLGLYPAERKFFDAKENTKLDFLIKKI
jgi:hypothetical protein